MHRTGVAIAIIGPAGAMASTASLAQDHPVQISSNPAPLQFSADNLKGRFGWHSVAFMNSSTSQPSAAAGLMIFDGKSNLSGYYSGNFLGTPIQQAFAGTCTVNPDGSGHLEFVQTNGSLLAYDLFIVSGGNEIFLVNTQQGTLQTVELKKQ